MASLRTIRRQIAAATAACAVALTLVGPGDAVAAADTPIQPGARVRSSVGSCTLNFVFKAIGAKTRYVGTAGHCVEDVGDVVRDNDGERIGIVVYRHFTGTSADDFALVRIDAGRRSEVNPAVRGWGGPSGYVRSGQSSPGDRLLLSGYGLGFSVTATTRSRSGLLMSQSRRDYRAWAPAIFGDSGGPVLHHDGRALGIVSGIAPGTGSTLIGPTVQRVLKRVRNAGFRVRLLKASYTAAIV